MAETSSHTLYSDSELRVLQKIETLLDESGEEKAVVVNFSKDEQEVLRQIIQIYQTLISFGRVGIWVKNLIIGAAAFIAGWIVIYNWAIGNLKDMLGL